MKRLVPIVIALALVGVFAGTLLFLYNKSQAKPVFFETEKPTVEDIIKKTVATGAIVPRREIEIKPRISGVLDELFVEPGQYVKEGEKIARIKIIPNMVNLNSAESAVKAARINYTNAERELARYRDLFGQKLISESEFNKWQLDFELRKQDLEAASSNLQLIKSGASKKSGKVQNVVTSTVEGMVIAVPVKEGVSVTETNNFNAGTTIASVADMNDMIFEGKVDESEVGKIKAGMELDVVIGAVDDERFKGTLEYISPKGVQWEGAIQFEIKASLKQKEGVFVRAGYSANADIVLDRRTQVLAINESLLLFEDDKTYVEVETAPQTFERREIEVGLSDGIKIEILKGIDENTSLKKPEMGGGSDGPGEKGGKGGKKGGKKGK
jgi:HlyD family secretion protein